MNKQIYYRLLSLWVLSEAMLGGIIHGLNLPVSGLLVGSCSVACISLIAWYCPEKGAVLKATIIVAAFKMLLSPHAPPTAYVAVFFQGLLGELLFRRDKKLFALSCLLLAVLALVESGFQRIIMLTILYGNDFWSVLDSFIAKLTGSTHTPQYSLYIGIGYLAIHLFTGLLVGAWLGRLPQRMEKWQQEKKYVLVPETGSPAHLEKFGRQRSRKGLWIIWFLLAAVYFQSYYGIGKPLLPAHISLKILLRSVLIVSAWVLFATPLLKKLLHGWLEKKKTQSRETVHAIVRLLPSTQQLAIRSWQKTKGGPMGIRLRNWFRLMMANAFRPQPAAEEKFPVVLYVAPVQTGKTTSLVEWSADRKDVYGILTPVVDGRRMFMDVHTRQLFSMEAREDETATVATGKFVFSRKNFDRASSLIRNALHNEGWLVIDEVGPLELNGEGFHGVLRQLLTERRQKTLLVVRERDATAEKVKSLFGIPDAIEICHTGSL